MKNLNSDFSDFNGNNELSYDARFKAELEKSILKKLNPSLNSILLKILIVHAFVSTLSLSFCHQFGINPFNTRFSVDQVFMKWGGHYFCIFICGFIFVGLSFLTLRWLLNPDELRVFNKNIFWPTLVVTLISITILNLLSYELGLLILLSWIGGALLGGLSLGKLSSLHIAKTNSLS